jgi:hypothetical protein
LRLHFQIGASSHAQKLQVLARRRATVPFSDVARDRNSRPSQLLGRRVLP